MRVSRRIADSYEVVADFEYVTCRLPVERGEIGEFEFKREFALFTGGKFFRLAVSISSTIVSTVYLDA